jgi:hypothetical protein
MAATKCNTRNRFIEANRAFYDVFRSHEACNALSFLDGTEGNLIFIKATANHQSVHPEIYRDVVGTESLS